MLPRENRLKLPTTWKKSKPDLSFFSPYFKVLVKKINLEEKPRIGFIISTKVGKATVRNRLRRFLSRQLRERLVELPNGLEIVFILSSQANPTDNEKLSSEVNKFLSKVSFTRPSAP